jgi:hypothetical protein
LFYDLLNFSLSVFSQEIHRLKFIELQKRRAEMRDLEVEIAFCRRELVPLTTGLVADVKRRRMLALRHRIHARRDGATKIQALWRRGLVRLSLYDPHRPYWVRRYDAELSDKPYYYNYDSKVTVWEMPLAYRYFGDRYEPGMLMN